MKDVLLESTQTLSHTEAVNFYDGVEIALILWRQRLEACPPITGIITERNN